MPSTVIESINLLLDCVQWSQPGSITDANKRLDGIFETPGGLGPQVNLLRLVSAYLGHLTVTDVGTWTEQDRDDVDGLLREIDRLAYETRTALAGDPECARCHAYCTPKEN